MKTSKTAKITTGSSNFSSFTNNKISPSASCKVKGGDDTLVTSENETSEIIIIEDIIDI